MTEKGPPRDAQLVGLVMAVLLTSIFVSEGGSLDGGLRVLLASIPACLVGLAILKLWLREELKRPADWTEWIWLYVLGSMVGGMLFLVGRWAWRSFH